MEYRLKAEDVKSYLEELITDYTDHTYWNPESTHPNDIWDYSIEVWTYVNFYNFINEHPDIEDLCEIERMYIARMREYYDSSPPGKFKDAYMQAIDLMYSLGEDIWQSYR